LRQEPAPDHSAVGVSAPSSCGQQVGPSRAGQCAKSCRISRTKDLVPVRSAGSAPNRFSPISAFSALPTATKYGQNGVKFSGPAERSCHSSATRGRSGTRFVPAALAMYWIRLLPVSVITRFAPHPVTVSGWSKQRGAVSARPVPAAMTDSAASSSAEATCWRRTAGWVPPARPGANDGKGPYLPY
jgi:hypothetical protein